MLQIKDAAKELPVVEQFTTHHSPLTTHPQVFVAGSSWPPDEDIFIRYFNEHPDWKLIIAPHVIGEDHLQQIIGKLGDRKVVRYTEAEKSPSSLLSPLSSYNVLIIVGGGFGVSIHNTVEAAVWGKPVIFGPNNQKFQEAQELKSCGGGIEIKGYDDFAQLMDNFCERPEEIARRGKDAGDYVMSRAGATQKILSDVTL